VNPFDDVVAIFKLKTFCLQRDNLDFFLVSNKEVLHSLADIRPGCLFHFFFFQLPNSTNGCQGQAIMSIMQANY
jgi:hypothetical protein